MATNSWLVICDAEAEGLRIAIPAIHGGGDGAGGGQEGTSTPVIPEELKPLITGSVNQILNTQGALPLSAFATATPQLVPGFSPYTAMGIQQTPGLSAIQPGSLGSFQAYTALPEVASREVPTPGATYAQQGLLQQLLGGPIGSSPATVGAMNSWRTNVLPTVQNEMALQGLGRSGPELEAVARSQTQALVPFVQQEIQNRMTSLGVLQEMANAETARWMYPSQQTLQALTTQAQGLASLGQSMFDQQVTAINQQLQAGQIQEDRARELFGAAMDDFLRLQNLSMAATLGPFGQLAPSMIGQETTTQRNIGALDILGK